MEILATNKKTKKVLITISGLDGSGKSTQAKLITEYLPNAELIHIVDFRLINRILTLGNNKKSLSGSKKNAKNKLVGWVNLLLLLIDMLYFKFYFKFQNKNLICDRYFYDLVASHSYRYGNSSILKFIIKLIPKANYSFFIKVDKKVAQNREKDDYHDLKYFEQMESFYDRNFRKKTFIEIKSQSIGEMKEIIHKIIINKGK